MSEPQAPADVVITSAEEIAQPALDRQEYDRKLELAQLQMNAYARDLQEVIQREKAKSRQLAVINAQLKSYARDLKTAISLERERASQLESAYYETISRLAHASSFKDKETGAHIRRLSHYGKLLALESGASLREAELIFAAAPMHDVGKIGIPDSVLHKEGPLSPEEWVIMRQHTEIGAALLGGSESRLLEVCREIAISHHERWDGTGYPNGLKGEDIPFAGRIIALCDVYDALRSDRPYKKGFTHEASCNIILEGDGRVQPEHFDPNVLAAFARIHQEFDRIFEETVDPTI